MDITATVMETTIAGLCATRDAACAPRPLGAASAVELRLDALDPAAGRPDAAAALAGRRVPAIVTCRPRWEGGRFDGPDAVRLSILADAAAAGAEWIDLEAETLRRVPDALERLGLPNGRTGVVLSYHDHAAGVDDAVPARLDAMRAVAATAGRNTVIKLAVTPASFGDVARLRALTAAPAADLIVIGMGRAGVVTRLAAHRFSSRWTYVAASVEPGAPGQVTLDAACRARVGALTPATRLYAIGGEPLGHSASPAMHNAAFAAAGVDAVFVPLETGDAGTLLRVAEALDVAGLSITAPLKRAVLDPACRVAPDAAAAAIGAVNTLRRAPGADAAWDARNFDAAAFGGPLEADGMPLMGRRVVVLGAGGAARAAASELARRGARVEIAARRDAAAAALAAALGVAAVAWPPSGPAALVVNATPAGTAPRIDETPLAGGPLTAEVAYDLVYNPADTRFLRDARAGGARTIGGLAMLAAQARAQFAWWTGRTLDVACFADAARQFVESN